MTPDERLATIALAGLPAMWPRRLRTILAHHPADEALMLLAAGRDLTPEVQRGGDATGWELLRRQAADADPTRLLDACTAAEIDIIVDGDADYPQALRHDPDRPLVVYVRGRLAALAARRVGIVGTRNASAAGRATASQLGGELSVSGVCVVSGLARGIDAAAHRGVRKSSCGTPPVAVVGCGIDRPYPKQNTDIWDWVGEHGALLSEWPPGTVPEGWRFPLRNRIIAALSEIVVVVESRERGGSLITAKLAADRGIDVMAVPGAIRSRAAEGTNKLLSEGAGMVTSVDDILVALGLDHSRQYGHFRPDTSGPTLGAGELLVLDACSQRPSTLDMLAGELPLGLAEISVALARLLAAGRVVDVSGWFEASGSRLKAPT